MSNFSRETDGDFWVGFVIGLLIVLAFGGGW